MAYLIFFSSQSIFGTGSFEYIANAIIKDFSIFIFFLSPHTSYPLLQHTCPYFNSSYCSTRISSNVLMLLYTDNPISKRGITATAPLPSPRDIPQSSSADSPSSSNTLTPPVRPNNAKEAYNRYSQEQDEPHKAPPQKR